MTRIITSLSMVAILAAAFAPAFYAFTNLA
jgi:hypothetical protein